MANIEVDLSEFKEVITAVDSCSRLISKKVYESSQRIDELKGAWFGEDYMAFEASWSRFTKSSSVDDLKNSLNNYSVYLEHVHAMYKKAQKTSLDWVNQL